MTHEVDKNAPLPCPRCHAETQNLKGYSVPDNILFLILYISYRNKSYIACPSCMRQIIGLRMLFNLITANLTWPIFSVIWGIQFARSFSAGHSGYVLRQLRRTGMPVQSVFT